MLIAFFVLLLCSLAFRLFFFVSLRNGGRKARWTTETSQNRGVRYISTYVICIFCHFPFLLWYLRDCLERKTLSAIEQQVQQASTELIDSYFDLCTLESQVQELKKNKLQNACFFLLAKELPAEPQNLLYCWPEMDHLKALKCYKMFLEKRKEYSKMSTKCLILRRTLKNFWVC